MILQFCWLRGATTPHPTSSPSFPVEMGSFSMRGDKPSGRDDWRLFVWSLTHRERLSWQRPCPHMRGVGLRSERAARLIPLPVCIVSFPDSDNVCPQYLWWNCFMTAGLTLTSLPLMPFWTVMDTLGHVARTLLSALFAAGAYLTLLHALLGPLPSWVLLISSNGWDGEGGYEILEAIFPRPRGHFFIYNNKWIFQYLSSVLCEDNWTLVN